MMEDKEKPSAIDSLEQKLYDPKQQIDNLSMHHVRDRKEKELPTSWGEDAPIIRPAEKEGGMSFGAKFLLGASLLLLFVLLFTAWRVLSSQNVVSSENIDLSLDITPYVEGGVDTPLMVGVTNNNDISLKEVTLTVLYKQGVGAQDEQEKIQIKRDLGALRTGDFKREEFQVALYGSEAEARDITVKLEYKIDGSNAVFSKIALAQVVLKSPPISVLIEGPGVLSVGQVGAYSLVVSNNTGTTTQASLLIATLPSNFTSEEMVPRPTGRGNIWNINELAPGEKATVKISGSYSGNQGELSTVRALVGSVAGSLTEVGVVYSSATFDTSLRTSPLSLAYSIDSERGSGESIRYGDRIFLTVTYKNNGKDVLQNASLVLKIGGDAALLKNVHTDAGYYDSETGTITWSGSSYQPLQSLDVGEQGTVQVSIPIITKGTNSPKLQLSIVGTASAMEQNDVTATVNKTYTVQGSASVQVSTKYKNSPFQNVGPIPPEPNVDTTYTVHMVVSAQNTLQNARVSFVLPAYVTWRNVSSDVSKITYDAKTRTISWNIGQIDAGKTVIADIGLSVRPSQVHVNTMPAITGGIVLDADETESKAHLKTTISGLTTFIEGEQWEVNPSLVVDR